MKKDYFEYASLMLMSISAVAMGALIIVPILLTYMKGDKKQITYSVFIMMVSYLVSSVVIASFNLLVFLSICLAFIFIKTKNTLVILPIGATAVMSAFLPIGNIVLVSFFVIGIALLIITQPEIINTIKHKKQEELTIVEDPKIQRIHTLKEFYRKKLENGKYYGNDKIR